MFKPSSIFLKTGPLRYCFCTILYVTCVISVVAVFSVPSSLVIVCWERTDPCPFRMRFSCVLSLSHMVYRVGCGIWLYRFLIFGFFLTLIPLIPLASSCKKIAHLCLSNDQRMGSDRLFCRWKFLFRRDNILTLKSMEWRLKICFLMA